MASKLRKKKGDTRIIGEREIILGELAVHCMCDLLTTHPYFNFSVNIANFLLPLLDNKRSNIRETIAACFMQIFKEDKRGQLSLTVSLLFFIIINYLFYKKRNKKVLGMKKMSQLSNITYWFSILFLNYRSFVV